MYIHLGQNTAVRLKNVVAVFDMENTTVSKNSRGFLEQAQKNGEIITVSDELPKTYVVCIENGETKVYISPVSSSTLLKRTGFTEIAD